MIKELISSLFKDHSVVPYSLEYLKVHMKDEMFNKLLIKYETKRGIMFIPKDVDLSKYLKDGYSSSKVEDTAFENTDGVLYYLTEDYDFIDVDRVTLMKSMPGMKIRIINEVTGEVVSENTILRKWGWDRLELDNETQVCVSKIYVKVDGSSVGSDFRYQMQRKDYTSLCKSEDLYFDMYPVVQLPDGVDLNPFHLITNNTSTYISKSAFTQVFEKYILTHNFHTVKVGEELKVFLDDGAYRATVTHVTNSYIQLDSGLRLHRSKQRAGGKFVYLTKCKTYYLKRI